MLKKLTRISTLVCTALLLCFLLSPTALAAESNSACNRNNNAVYQQARQIMLQNVGSCLNNNQAQSYVNQAREYKITEACPIPSVNNCKPATNSSNCNNSNTAANCNNNTADSQQNSSCTAVKPVQTTKPAQPAAPSNQSNTATVAVSNYAEEVVRLVNAERAKNNLPALTLDKQLTAAAQVRAQEATVKFSHTRPDGSSCFSVLSSMGISYRRAGENIAIGQSSPSQVVKAWMDSPGHRANILGDYTKIGVGVQQASGNFSGYSWAQFFTK